MIKTAYIVPLLREKNNDRGAMCSPYHLRSFHSPIPRSHRLACVLG